MGHQDNGVLRRAQQVYSVGNDAEGIDIQTGVGLVQQGQFGLQDGHLQNLVPFLLTTGESFIDRPLHQIGVDLYLLDLSFQHLVELTGAHLFFVVMDTAGVHASLQELPGPYAWKFQWVLESQEKAHAGPDLRL